MYADISARIGLAAKNVKRLDPFKRRSPAAPPLVKTRFSSSGDVSATTHAAADTKKMRPSHRMLENQKVTGLTPVIIWTWNQLILWRSGAAI